MRNYGGFSSSDIWGWRYTDLNQFIALNLNPLVFQLSQRCAAWKFLPLTPVGRVNLIKMTVLPKFTYLFRQTPVAIPVSFLKDKIA